MKVSRDKDGSKVTTVVATPGQGPDRPQEVSYTDTKVIGNGSLVWYIKPNFVIQENWLPSRRYYRTRDLRTESSKS